jgi:hypothetical protein
MMDNSTLPPVQQHRQAWDSIPWVLNGTATESERELLMAHLQACLDCRAEFDFQRSLHAGLGLVEPAQGLDADRALQAFWATEQGSAAPAPPVPPVLPRRHRWLVAAVLIQAVGLAGFAALLGLRATPADYQVLSSPELAASGASIRIVPAPGMQIGELRALLARSDLQLVQSSSDAGHFAVALAPAARFDRDQALQRLRAEPGILLAEPILVEGR